MFFILKEMLHKLGHFESYVYVWVQTAPDMTTPEINTCGTVWSET